MISIDALPKRFETTLQLRIASENLIICPTPLKQLLLEAAKKPNLVTGKLPSQGIDLDEFGWESERLIKMSIADPDHHEFYNVTCIDDRGRLLMLREPMRGRQPGEVNIPLSFFNGKRTLLDKHSHGDIDCPLSMGDLESLFANPELPGASSGVLVATLTTKMLALRTEQTPIFANTDDLVMDLQKHPALEEENELWLNNYKAAGGCYLEYWEIIPITEETKRGVMQLSHKRMFALSRIAQKYHLGIYACPLDKNIAYPIH